MILNKTGKTYSEAYQQEYPELADQLTNAINGKVLIDTNDILTFDTGKLYSTRVASGEAINHYVKSVPAIFGGSADLSHSTMTEIKGEQMYAVESYGARNVYFGVREHAMGAAANGMAYHGGAKPFVRHSLYLMIIFVRLSVWQHY